jgi:ElaB/YqjD/DUF883 family membrane-anchored ribosome-binding protein
MAVTSEMRRVGEQLKSQFDGAIDQVSSVASNATDAVRDRTSRLAGSAQEFYDELDGDTPGDKLRAAVATYPLSSLAIAAAAGFLLARWLRA